MYDNIEASMSSVDAAEEYEDNFFWIDFIEMKVDVEEEVGAQ